MFERFFTYGKKSAGFACFLVWVYCSFFSCALVPIIYELRCSERFWCIAAAMAGIAAMAFNLAFRNRAVRNEKPLCIIGAACAAAGTVVIWFGFFNEQLYPVFYSAGGILVGVGLATLHLFWGDTLSKQDEESVELVIPCGFVIAGVCYLVLLPLKSLAAVLIIAALPCVSLFLGLKQRAAMGTDPAAKSTATAKTAEAAEVVKIPYVKDRLFILFFLQAALWFNFAFFRTFSSPNYPSDRFVHYLIPFSISCTISVLILVASLRTARSVSFSLAHRIALPLMCLSYAVLALSPSDAAVRGAAYTVNFISMFTMQLGMWLAMAHYVSIRKVSAHKVFGWFLAMEGVGIATGVFVGLGVVEAFGASLPVALVLFFMTVPVALAMAYGYNDRAPRRIAYQAFSDDAQAASIPDEGYLIAAATLRQAKVLAERYYLSKRECEVLALLLEGRNRPYIRDELFISLNTVNAHVRSIYAKCNVHSQQELLDLARAKEAVTLRTSR